jgi:hypothetical protein
MKLRGFITPNYFSFGHFCKILDENQITSIPSMIGKMKNLKEVQMRKLIAFPNDNASSTMSKVVFQNGF